MKKQILLFILMMLPMVVSADKSGSCGENVTYSYVESTHTLTISGSGAMTDYYYSNNTVNSPWYSYSSDIVKAIIEDGITSIGNHAFYKCSGLTSVTIPNSVTSIGNSAFYGCSGLTSVNIPNSVTSIGNYAFSYCSGLTSMTIPNSVTFIGDRAFFVCGLISVTIPNSVTSIGSEAFSRCIGLTSVTIPNSVTSIGDYAFYYCKALSSVTICCDLTSTGRDVFSNCEKLSSITFHCQKIPSLFSNFTSIKEVTIGDEVTSIGSSAFYGCTGLTSITIPNSVTSIGSQAFYNTGWYNNQDDGILYLGNWLVGWKGQQPTGDYVIVDGTKGIACRAFSDCTNLTTITIPSSVTSIGECAFQYCSGLTSVAIPSSVTSIGDYAFSGCSGLTSMIIPNSVMSIGEGTFYGCTNLTTITIPSSVKSIVAGAFYNCGRISSVYISDLAAWCNITFLNGKYNYVSKETANPFYSNNEHHLYLNGKEVTNLDISQEATIIHEKAFYNCKSITSVTIPNSVTSIESAAFSGCSGLNSVTIPNSVTEIGNGAFSGCDNLLTVNSEITEPFNCKDAFSNETLRKGTLKVPAGTKDLYIRFDGWREFLKIEEVGSAEPQQYLLSFVVDNKELSAKKVDEGATITPPTKDNNGNAISWYTYPTTMPAHDLVVYGMVPKPEAAAKYTITYVLDGQTYRTVIVEEGASVSKEKAPYKEGYTFNGWQNEPTTMPGHDVTVNGTFNVNTYHLSFIVDNEELETKNVEYGTSITAPTKDGEGNNITWYTYPATMPAHDLVVYGMVPKPAAPEKYTITYKLDGQTYRTVVVEEGATVSKEKTPYKDGYTFNGWQNEPSTMPGYDVTVNGTFNVNTYHLSFIVDNEELETKNVEYGAAITVPTKDSEGNNITWYTHPMTMPAHDLVVYGMVPKPAAPEKYTITYKLDGQTYRTIVVEEGATVSKEKTPYKEGYTFNGWQNAPTTMPGRDVTVNGTFSVNTYRLSFIVDNEELETKNVEYGAAITVPAKDGEGNDITWYTHPTTMPAHDLVVYGMVVKKPEPEVFVWLTIKDGQGTTKMKVKQGLEQVLTIMPEEGWKILSVTMDGTDVTAQATNGGSFTTPAINSDASIIIVYEQEAPSGVRATRSQTNVKVVSDGVVISNAEPETRCIIYSTDGQQVVNTIISEGTRKITLQQGQVYILTIDGRTLKFAL